jgi:plastocyanin
MTSVQRVLALLLAAPLAACTVGDITGGNSGDDDGSGDDVSGGPDAAVQDFAITMSPTQANTTLGTETHYTVTLDSSNFAGAVTLTATGVPETWSYAFVPSATVTVPLDGQITAELVVTVPPDAIASTASLGVSAAGTVGTRTIAGSLVVANEFIIDLPDGTKNGTHPFPPNLQLRVGTTLRVRTLDTQAPHRIHSDGGLGFPHQDTSMTAGQEYDALPGEAGSYRFYCHDHGEGLGATNLTMIQ